MLACIKTNDCRRRRKCWSRTNTRITTKLLASHMARTRKQSRKICMCFLKLYNCKLTSTNSRKPSKAAHPNKGGSEAKMALLNKTYEITRSLPTRSFMQNSTTTRTQWIIWRSRAAICLLASSPAAARRAPKRLGSSCYCSLPYSFDMCIRNARMNFDLMDHKVWRQSIPLTGEGVHWGSVIISRNQRDIVLEVLNSHKFH